jgi:hypothetical protein
MHFHTELNNNKISEICSVNIKVLCLVLREWWEECGDYQGLEEVQPDITKGSTKLDYRMLRCCCVMEKNLSHEEAEELDSGMFLS